MIVVDGHPHLSRPPAQPVRWRARVADGPWRELEGRFQFAFEARREAARLFGTGPEYVEVERLEARE